MYKKIGISLVIFVLLTLVITPIVSSETIGTGSITALNQEGTFKVKENLDNKVIFLFGKDVIINMRDGGEIQIGGRPYSGENSFKINSFFGFAIQFWGGASHVIEDSRLFVLGFGIGIEKIDISEL